MTPHPPDRPDLPSRSRQSLDWPRVVEALADRTTTTLGRELAEALPALPDPASARAILALTGEMLGLLERREDPPLAAVLDLRGMLTALQKGEILEGGDLSAAGQCLDTMVRLADFFRRVAPQVPGLYAIAGKIRPFPDLADWLQQSFDARGELSAASYPQLRELRTKKARLHEQIRSTLAELSRGERWSNSLQDDFVALRNDRYVLPAKVQDKRAGLGVVHDTSGSGQTVFIEPFEVIDLNNDLKLAESELRNEELRILRDLGERVALVAPDIRRSLEAVGKLDDLRARAVLARDLRCVLPEILEGPVLRLLDARHPVLVLRGVDVVPNDLRLGEGPSALVISGPNTGGKTVALKTMGVFALMARAGLAVPAAPGTAVGWFPLVLSDIGDLQDIEGDLSTFSGHVMALVQIFEAVDREAVNALVLLDEIAVGTDPVQGAALGRAVLEALLARRVLLATTTHYPELKALSASDPRFLNARAEFDGDMGRPTFRLGFGRPGSSHALDIARRVGLPEEILDDARRHLGPRGLEVEELLTALETQVAAARRDREEATRAREHAEAALEGVRKQASELERRSKVLERELRASFDAEVREYRDQVRAALHQIEAERSREAVARARDRVQEGAEQVRDALGGWQDMEVPFDWGKAAPGQAVHVVSLSKNGTLVELPDGKGRLVVLVEGRRVQAKKEEIQAPHVEVKVPRAPAPVRAKPAPAVVSDDPDLAIRTERSTLDLRGQRVDEALARVDRFLDESSLDGRDFVFVLHGVGTGALLTAVRTHLRASPYVAEQAPGNRQQGGDGITVVRMRR
jgi:DNA mismatch repair protein MutS2